MKKITIALVAALLLILLFCVVAAPHRHVAVVPAPGASAPTPPALAATSSSNVPPRLPEDAYYRAIDGLNDPSKDIQADLKILDDVFQRYQVAVKDPSGNPIGTNDEIVHALQGRNRAHLVFLPAAHPSLNAKGELIDRWGTPFFFHALSGRQMEIRSAGPDRAMWTEDDAVYPRQRAPLSASGI